MNRCFFRLTPPGRPRPPGGVWRLARDIETMPADETRRFAMEWTVTGNGGGSGPVIPVVNEMLLHDVYDLPLEVLRSTRRDLHNGKGQPSCRTSWMSPTPPLHTPSTPISS